MYISYPAPAKIEDKPKVIMTEGTPGAFFAANGIDANAIMIVC